MKPTVLTSLASLILTPALLATTPNQVVEGGGNTSYVGNKDQGIKSASGCHNAGSEPECKPCLQVATNTAGVT